LPIVAYRMPCGPAACSRGFANRRIRNITAATSRTPMSSAMTNDPSWSPSR
jgi:hypothetical protein